MKKTILILLAILSMSCQAQQKNDMNQDKVKFYPKDLVYIKSIPQQKEILSIALKKDGVSSNTALNASLFKIALDHDNTRTLNPNNELDDKLLSGYSYSPWYTIEFTTVKGNYKITLFLGGLGFMTLPNGKRGAVLFDFSDLKKEEDKKLLSYYKKIKRKTFSTLSGDEDDVKEIKLYLGGKVITYNIDGDAIQINNISPHPSKEFSENQGIHQYTIKEGNSKVSFWKRDTQVSETGNCYPKMVADFIATAERLTTQQGAFNATMQLIKDEVLVFPDGLKIELTGFNHKRTFDREESYKYAIFKISKNHNEEQVFKLGEGTNKDELGRLITRYDLIEFGKYKIVMTKFHPVEITVYKKEGIDSLFTQYGKYHTITRLWDEDLLVFPNGLKIQLNELLVDGYLGDQKISAELKISDNYNKESPNLYVTRHEYFDKQKNIVKTHESAEYSNYKIELINLDYNFIDIVVSKKTFLDITNELSVAEFEQIKNFILKNKGRQTYRNYDNNSPHFAFVDFDLYLGADIGQKNLNNDPEISDFNELVIKHNILGAPITYYNIVIVRKGDLNTGKAHILEGMKEDKVYLVDLYKVGLDKLKKQLPPFLKTIRESMNDSK